MIKIFRFLFFMLILTAVSKNLLGNNSSSYLISQQAFKNYDFFTVLDKFKIETVDHIMPQKPKGYENFSDGQKFEHEQKLHVLYSQFPLLSLSV